MQCTENEPHKAHIVNAFMTKTGQILSKKYLIHRIQPLVIFLFPKHKLQLRAKRSNEELKAISSNALRKFFLMRLKVKQYMRIVSNIAYFGAYKINFDDWTIILQQ